MIKTPPYLVFQWAVCHRKAMQREKYRTGICCQVHQEASEHGQLSWGAPGGDRAGGGHPAAASAPKHRHAARRLREPHRRGAHPAAVSGNNLFNKHLGLFTESHCHF